MAEVLIDLYQSNTGIFGHSQGTEVYPHFSDFVYVYRCLLTSALDGGECSTSRSGRFTPREGAPDTHWTGGWVVPRAGLNAVVKRNIPSPCRDSNPPIIKPVAQPYTTELSRLPRKE
jgi:hypothetical protein